MLKPNTWIFLLEDFLHNASVLQIQTENTFFQLVHHILIYQHKTIGPTILAEMLTVNLSKMYLMYIYFKVLWCRVLWSQVLWEKKTIFNTINEYALSICQTRQRACPYRLCSKYTAQYPRHSAYREIRKKI